MFKHIKAVAFDMDGLIFDTERLYQKACFEAAKEFQLDFDETFYLSMVGQTMAFGRALFLKTYGDDFPMDQYQRRWSEIRYELIKADGVDFKQGFESLFQHVQTLDLPISLVTTSSFSEVQTNFGSHPQLSQFHSVITSSDPYPPKPAPDKYLAAAERMHVTPQSMLVLEDSNTGMMAAINARANAVMIPDLIQPKAEVREQALAIFDSLTDVEKGFSL